MHGKLSAIAGGNGDISHHGVGQVGPPSERQQVPLVLGVWGDGGHVGGMGSIHPQKWARIQ